MKELDELIRISKLLRNIAFSTFIVLWAEVIFMLGVSFVQNFKRKKCVN